MWVPRRNYNRRALTGQVGVFPRRLLLYALVACLLAGCAHGTDLTRSDTQANFGVKMARMNLWREAMFRFQRALQITPDDAKAHNNLAVAYEANGEFERARKEYLEALRLDRSNQYIQKNYSRFVEFLSRNKKRESKDVKMASAPAPPPAPGATTTAPPEPAPQPQPSTPPPPAPPGRSR